MKLTIRLKIACWVAMIVLLVTVLVMQAAILFRVEELDTRTRRLEERPVIRVTVDDEKGAQIDAESHD